MHEALRIGEWIPVEVDGSLELYAFLRVSNSETLLVLINLDDEPIQDYTLSVAVDGIFEMTVPVVILGDQEATRTDGMSRRGFDNYKPFSQVGAYETMILALR